MSTSESAIVGNTRNVNALIVDKRGELGKLLAEIFSQHASTVFVSKVKPPTDSSIIHISFSETIPTIPDGFYSYMVYVFNREDKDMIEPLMKKASLDKVHFFIVVSHEEIPLLSEHLANKNVYGHVVVMGDLFGHGEGAIEKWMYESKKSKKIALSNMGLNSWYPVFFDDGVQALFSVCTANHQSAKEIYLIAPPYPITQLTIAHSFQKIDPLLKIDFAYEDDGVSSSLPKGKHIGGDFHALEKLVDFYQHALVREHGEKVPFGLFSTPTGRKEKKKGSVLLFVVYTVIIFILMPVFLMVASGLIGRWLLLSGFEDIKHGDLSSSQQKINAAVTNITFSQFSAQLVSREASLMGQDKLLLPFTNQLSLAQEVGHTFSEGIAAGRQLQAVFLGTSKDSLKDTREGADGLKATLVMLQKLQTEDLPVSYKENLRMMGTSLQNLETVADSLPQLIGPDGDRAYLVLFQNNTELRPGGGFIGSYGVLHMHHGAVKDFNIHDVYDADGQLKGHVEPHFAIRRYMPLVHLYLRDSNFDVDFSKNADKAAFMLQAETGESVDGVVAIDLSFVKNSIGALGSIYVPSYNQTVTKDNLFLLTEEHAEKNSFPGSTQKKDFLSSLFSALQDKLVSRNGVSFEKLFASLLQGVEEKHVLFAAREPSIQSSLSVNGLSSALLDTREKKSDTLNDFLGINEANIGVDKVNYFIQRAVSQKVRVSEKGEVKESVMLTYTNTSDGKWPGGVYKNYLRFILPKGATLDGISLNDTNQKIVPTITDPQFYEAPGFVPPTGLEVDKTEENGKAIYGFLITVPTKSTLQVVLSYTLADTANMGETLSTYSLQLFKQPGIDVLPYSLNIFYPQSYSLLKANQKIEADQKVVTFSDNIVKDTLLELSFSK